ncbi:hypothetical protein [Shewanella sp. CG12_big_fil_rev_8_21_14_0_65_47_15]|uniref:hypothetical protein n=1 Tax=Shewanella sp. CG12_big_fil_rev_8_21_14_0_65_47_15 TaxID=1975537 RepID=UPI000CBE6A9F|nr:hypothetical protein [Shewanella sp. CG12_big_fil_rev_8_21_14_0_65_47_15]PIW61333.1 MAG: hypothetical protein COW15_08510 [Shewanella sp. CG12_big_fil_rev_8_21_14_0_65_47_15]
MDNQIGMALWEFAKLFGAGLFGGIGAKLLDIRFQTKREEKELNYLSIMLAAQLEEFVIGCSYVTLDDGKYHGQVHPTDGYVAQVPSPKLDFSSLDVNWRLVKTMTLHRIWQVPIKLKRVEERLIADQEWCDGSGYDYINRRRFYYSEIGLYANDIFMELLKTGGLSKAGVSEEYSDALDTIKSYYKTFKPKH